MSITVTAGRRAQISARVSTVNQVLTASIKEIHNFISCSILGNNYDTLVGRDPEGRQSSGRRQRSLRLTKGSYPRGMSKDS